MSARNLNFDDYKVKAPYPNRPSKPTISHSATAADARRYADDMDKWEADKAAYDDVLKAWRAEDARMTAKFREDALKAVGLWGHPKADKIYAFAWEHGHSSGLSEVANWLDDLADLFVDG